MTLVRSLLFGALLHGSIGIFGTLYLPLLVLPRRWLVPASRLWCRAVMAALRHTVGLTWRCEGQETLPPRPFIVAAKHQSAWDTLVWPLLVDDPAIVLKRELLWLPLFGWYLARIGMLAIDRAGGGATLRRLVRRARRVTAAGRPVIIFPEGTRTAPGIRLPYQPGVAALYRGLGVPVVPVALNSGHFWPRRRLVKRPGCITVRFLPPIQPGLEGRTFLAELERRIETASAELGVEAAGQGD